MHFYYDIPPCMSIVFTFNTRSLYWTDWGNVAKIEKASMDGENRTVIHHTDLVWPSGLTIDYVQQVMYWTDNSRSRIESSNIDGSNRRTVSSQRIYQPFGISVYRNTLYYTDFISGVNALNVSETVRKTILNSLCEDAVGIEVFSIDRQPTGIYLNIIKVHCHACELFMQGQILARWATVYAVIFVF